MFGSTIDITTGVNTYTLNRINEANYSSEYFLRNAAGEFRLKIRHSTERAAAGKIGLDRHNVELSIRIFATPTSVEKSQVVSIVVRNSPDNDGSLAVSTALGLVNFLAEPDVLRDVVGWLS